MNDQSRGDGTAADDGEPLVGDGVTPGIVRIGDTVRRPVRPFTATVQAYLAHLHGAGFTAAPVPLGIDDQGREVLSFVPGDVPREPLPPGTAGEDVLAALARLVRRLHDAAQGWTPPPDAVWAVQRSGPGGRRRWTAPRTGRPPRRLPRQRRVPGRPARGPHRLRPGPPDHPALRHRQRPLLVGVADTTPKTGRRPSPTADIPRRAAVFADAYACSPDSARTRTDGPPDDPPVPPVNARRRRKRSGLPRTVGSKARKDRLPRAEAWIEGKGPRSPPGSRSGQPTALGRSDNAQERAVVRCGRFRP